MSYASSLEIVLQRYESFFALRNNDLKSLRNRPANDGVSHFLFIIHQKKFSEFTLNMKTSKNITRRQMMAQPTRICALWLDSSSAQSCIFINMHLETLQRLVRG